MTHPLPKIAFVSPHCVLDFTNGAATATRDALRLLAEQGFECQAFCGTRLDDAQERLLQESLFRRGVPYEVRKAKIPLLARPTPSPKQTPSPPAPLPPSMAGEGSYDARLLFTVDGNLPVTVFENASTRGGWLNVQEAQAFLNGLRHLPPQEPTRRRLDLRRRSGFDRCAAPGQAARHLCALCPA
jgi:hypothetical protein